jgi:hypothetical protein
VVSAEQVERFRKRAAQERARAERIVHPGHRKAALDLADQYEAVAGAYARLIALGGGIIAADEDRRHGNPADNGLPQ